MKKMQDAEALRQETYNPPLGHKWFCTFCDKEKRPINKCVCKPQDQSKEEWTELLKLLDEAHCGCCDNDIDKEYIEKIFKQFLFNLLASEKKKWVKILDTIDMDDCGKNENEIRTRAKKNLINLFNQNENI